MELLFLMFLIVTTPVVAFVAGYFWGLRADMKARNDITK